MRQDFDCGEPLTAVKQWPKEGEMTALFDSDIVPYIVGFSKDPLQYWQAKQSDNFEDHFAWKACIEHASQLINRWITQAGCDSCLFYVTDSDNNFRNEIAVSQTYKGDRTAEKPPFFHELKQWLVDFHEARVSDNCEADDEISIEAWKRIKQAKEDGIELWTEMHKEHSNFKILSLDKDLSIIPTWHSNLDDGEDFWITPLGHLDPVYKPKMVNEYAYWPLFKGEPVDVRNCSFMDIDDEGTIMPKPYHEHPCSTGDIKAVRNEIWFYSPKGVPEMQDVYTKGVNQGKGKFKRVIVGKIEVDVIVRLKGGGLKFFYSQLLTGDTADCYSGLKGVGASTAFEKLNFKMSEKELHHTVLSMYKEKHRHLAEEKMLESGQLAWMQTYPGELWQHPESSQDRSFPL